MPTITTGIIRSLKVPDAFTQHDKEVAGVSPDYWLESYRIAGENFPEISIRYSGYPMFSDDVPAFRGLLAKGEHTVFELGNPKYSLKSNIEMVKEVSPGLGNAGDNQVARPDTGPMFNLKKMSVREVQGRMVLEVTGWFQTQSLEPRVFLSCLFIDTSPQAKECKVEELYLQAFPVEQFEEYQEQFESMLTTISWAN